MIYLLIPNTSVHAPLCVISPTEGTFYALNSDLQNRKDIEILSSENSHLLYDSERLFTNVNIYTRNIKGVLTANNELFLALEIKILLDKEILVKLATFLSEKLLLPQNKGQNILDCINITKTQTIKEIIESVCQCIT